jgi:hypothetical protein
MKLLAWNLNHRAARRQIPSWIAAAINEQAPDILVLTEYVEGPDHDFFLTSLNANGLSEFSCSAQPGRENQVLISFEDPLDQAPWDSLAERSPARWVCRARLAGPIFQSRWPPSTSPPWPLPLPFLRACRFSSLEGVAHVLGGKRCREISQRS